MAREQQFNNGGRQVINTIEDTSKYQTGDARRLRVVADPLRIYEAPRETNLSKLTEALGTIKPDLMNWAVNKKTEMNKAEIEAGKRKAQSGEIAQGELEQYGYDSVKAVNDWTDFNESVLSAYDQEFDKDNGDLEAFIKQKWEANKFDDKSEVYMSKFSPLVGKTLEKIRETQGKYTSAKIDSRNNAELTRMFAHDINDVMGAGMEYDVPQYEARRANLQAMFPGKTNSQLDELAYQAVLTTMEETGDTSLVNIFKKPHSDKTPGLYEIPKWKDKIDGDVHKILSAKNSARKEAESGMEKALKEAANVKERELLFGIADANTFDDPTVKAEKLRGLLAQAKSYSDTGIPISEPIIKALITANTGIDKKQETEYQAQNYVTLRLGNPSTAQIAKALNDGSISLSGFEKLMTKREAAANRSDKGEKPLTSNPFMKQALKDIETNAGYSWASMTPENEQARKNADAVKARVIDYAEDLIETGVNPKDAAAQASEAGIKMLREAGMDSKSLRDANRKLDDLEFKRKDPAGFYMKNPKVYLEDRKTGAVSKSIPNKQLIAIQRQALKQAQSDNLRNHESTR
jgi:hypothetical protein